MEAPALRTLILEATGRKYHVEDIDHKFGKIFQRSDIESKKAILRTCVAFYAHALGPDFHLNSIAKFISEDIFMSTTLMHLDVCNSGQLHQSECKHFEYILEEIANQSKFRSWKAGLKLHCNRADVREKLDFYAGLLVGEEINKTGSSDYGTILKSLNKFFEDSPLRNSGLPTVGLEVEHPDGLFEKVCFEITSPITQDTHYLAKWTSNWRDILSYYENNHPILAIELNFGGSKDLYTNLKLGPISNFVDNIRAHLMPLGHLAYEGLESRDSEHSENIEYRRLGGKCKIAFHNKKDTIDAECRIEVEGFVIPTVSNDWDYLPNSAFETMVDSIRLGIVHSNNLYTPDLIQLDRSAAPLWKIVQDYRDAERDEKRTKEVSQCFYFGCKVPDNIITGFDTTVVNQIPKLLVAIDETKTNSDEEWAIAEKTADFIRQNNIWSKRRGALKILQRFIQSHEPKTAWILSP